MHRNTLKTRISTSVAATSNVFPTIRAKVTDKRLLGTWLYEKQRSEKVWLHWREQTDQQDVSLGDFRMRFTSTYWHNDLDGDVFRLRYSVLARDARSVVISFAEGTDCHLQQIFFEDGGRMYILSGYRVEFYRRVEA